MVKDNHFYSQTKKKKIVKVEVETLHVTENTSKHSICNLIKIYIVLSLLSISIQLGCQIHCIIMQIQNYVGRRLDSILLKLMLSLTRLRLDRNNNFPAHCMEHFINYKQVSKFDYSNNMYIHSLS